MLGRLLLVAAAALLSGARATYRLRPGDPQLFAAQSYAQSRNSGRPPIRTLNPASKVPDPRPAVADFQLFNS